MTSRRILNFALAVSLLVLGGCANAHARSTKDNPTMTDPTNPADDAAIRAALTRYETALNTSDTDAVMKLYTDDGVFMPQHFPSAVGSTSVRKAYEGVFKAIQLNVKFEILEVRQVAPNWAFARTNSAGTVKILADGSGGPEANQELFVLEKTDGGDWKIARYSFSTTNPPRG